MRPLLAILVLLTTLPCDGQVRRRALNRKPSTQSNPLSSASWWFIADNAIPVTGASNLSWWPAEGGSVFFATNTTAQVLTNNAAPNSHKATRSASGNDYLIYKGLAVTNILTSVTAATYMAVINWNGDTSGFHELLHYSQGGAASQPRLNVGSFLTSGLRVAGNSEDSGTSKVADIVVFPANIWFLLTVQVSYTNNYVSVWTNATQFINDTTWGVASQATPATSSIAAQSALNSSFGGLLAEQALWPYLLSGSDRSNVMTSLQTKYSLW